MAKMGLADAPVAILKIARNAVLDVNVVDDSLTSDCLRQMDPQSTHRWCMLGNADDGMNMCWAIDAMVAVALELSHKSHWLDQTGIHGACPTTDQAVNPIGEPFIKQRQKPSPIIAVGPESDGHEEVVIAVDMGPKPLEVLLVGQTDHLLPF